MWTAILPYEIDLGVKIGLLYGGFGIFHFSFPFLSSFCVPVCFNRSLDHLDEMFTKRVSAKRLRQSCLHRPDRWSLSVDEEVAHYGCSHIETVDGSAVVKPAAGHG